jgi:predicted  nucleic acid-binding Zn-ribbon protein
MSLAVPDLVSQCGLLCFAILRSALYKGESQMSEPKVSKRNQYIAKMKSQLDDMNEQLDKLEEKSKGAKADLTSKYKQEIADLRAKSDRAVAKLDEIKQAGEDSWDDMVSKMEKVGNAFKHSYNYFKSQL